MNDQRNDDPRRFEDGSEEELDFLNREDDPDVDIDERDDFESPEFLDDEDDPDLADLEPELVTEEAPVPSEPAAPVEPEEPTALEPEKPTAAAAAATAAAATAVPPEDDTPPRTARRRERSRRGPSPIMFGALGLIIVAAALILWPRGGSVTDSGEGVASVLTLPDSSAHAPTPTPRSSDVDLNEELSEMVPERATGDVPPPAAKADLLREADARTGDRGVLAEPETVSPIPSGDPAEQGAWAIQLGSFGSRVNAENLAAGLAEKGHRMEIQDLGGSHRVWVAYFPTRAAATAYAGAHAEDLGERPYITHR